jgi:hypothetical protein
MNPRSRRWAVVYCHFGREVSVDERLTLAKAKQRLAVLKAEYPSYMDWAYIAYIPSEKELQA